MQGGNGQTELKVEGVSHDLMRTHRAPELNCCGGVGWECGRCDISQIFLRSKELIQNFGPRVALRQVFFNLIDNQA